MLYRIQTENKNLGKVEELCKQFFEGFTIIKGEGFWKLTKENTLIIEVETDWKARVEKLAKAIKDVNSQEAVMLTELANTSWLV
jgi:hypothetical protein